MTAEAPAVGVPPRPSWATSRTYDSPSNGNHPSRSLRQASSAVACCWDTYHGCNGCNGGVGADHWCGQSVARCQSCGGFSCAADSSSDHGGGQGNKKDEGGEDKGDDGENSGGWVSGTYVTRYWDCCKPSCSWPGRGTMATPVRACNSDGSTADVNAQSVCSGGTSGACSNAVPRQVSEKLSYGFAAAAVSGSAGLSGDENCGQCYELVFKTGHSHIVQVTNIGHDVNGDHSFDLQIPGGGRGIFKDGCARMHGGSGDDADCGEPYGGCKEKSGCLRLPKALQAGCEWRFGWLTEAGRLGNPRIRFRRVRCPPELVAISGGVAADDADHPQV